MHPSIPDANPIDLDCTGARELVSARHDGELADARVLDLHLARCPACREHERALEELHARFDMLRAGGPDAGLGPRILELARQVSPARPRTGALPSVRVRALAALAGLAAALALLLGLERALSRAADPAQPLAHLENLLAPIARPRADATQLARTPEHLLIAAVQGGRAADEGAGR